MSGLVATIFAFSLIIFIGHSQAESLDYLAGKNSEKLIHVSVKGDITSEELGLFDERIEEIAIYLPKESSILLYSGDGQTKIEVSSEGKILASGRNPINARTWSAKEQFIFALEIVIGQLAPPRSDSQ